MSLAGSRLRPAPWDPWSWRHVRSRRCLTRESLALGRHQGSPIICMVFRGVALRELALSDHQASTACLVRMCGSAASRARLGVLCRCTTHIVPMATASRELAVAGLYIAAVAAEWSKGCSRVFRSSFAHDIAALERCRSLAPVNFLQSYSELLTVHHRAQLGCSRSGRYEFGRAAPLRLKVASRRTAARASIRKFTVSGHACAVQACGCGLPRL